MQSSTRRGLWSKAEKVVLDSQRISGVNHQISALRAVVSGFGKLQAE
jgi:hypothetical protein